MPTRRCIGGALWLAGFFTYATARLLTRSRPAAVLAGVIYMSAPYLMVNVHARAAFTEAMGQGLLPFVVYSSLRCYLSAWLSPWLFLAGIAWALLAMTHNITYVCGSFFVGLLFVGLSLHRRGVAMGLWRVGAAYALGCVLAMYFLAPVFTAAPDLVIQRNLPLMIAFNNLVPFSLLLESISLPSGHSGTPNLNPALGLPTLLAVAACVYAFSHRQPIEATALPPRRMGLLLLALFALAVFLTWSPFDFWQYFPRLVNLPQFTYRFMTYAAWTGSLLSAYALVTLFHGELDRRHVAIGVPLILLAHASFLPPFLPSDIALEKILREPDMRWGASDYLIDFRGWPVADAVPVTAIQPYCLRDGDTYRCHIPVSDAPAVVQLPALYYPRLLDVRVDGKAAPYLLTARDPYPMAGVRLEPGFHAVDVRFRGLGWANWVSGVAWAGVLAILGLLLGRSRLIRSRAIRERVAREPREKAG